MKGKNGNGTFLHVMSLSERSYCILSNIYENKKTFQVTFGNLLHIQYNPSTPIKAPRKYYQEALETGIFLRVLLVTLDFMQL